MKIRLPVIANATLFATGTFALGLALMMPVTSDAVDTASSPTAAKLVMSPKLNIGGVTLTVSQQSPTTQPATSLATYSDANLARGVQLMVHAENTTGVAVSGKFNIALRFVSPTNFALRVLPTPTTIWTDAGKFELPPGASRDFVFTSPALSANRIYTVALSSPTETVSTLSLVTKSDGKVATTP
jgi:hypothetical protein